MLKEANEEITCSKKKIKKQAEIKQKHKFKNQFYILEIKNIITEIKISL